MNELNKISGIDVAVKEIAGEVEKNLLLVKEKLQPYVSGAVTEDTLQAWKGDRAKLNKERAAYKGERTGLEKAWKERLEPISDAYKQIDAEYSNAIDSIDSQTKAFELMRIEKKREKIEKIFSEYVQPKTVEGWYTLDDLYNRKWENATYKEKDIQKEIQDAFETLFMMHSTILSLNHKYQEEGLKTLKETKNLQSAINRMNDLKAVEEARKAREEEERRAKEEAEKMAAVQEKEPEKEPEEPEQVEPKDDGFGFAEPEDDGFEGFSPWVKERDFNDYDDGFGEPEEPEMVTYVVTIRKDCEKAFIEMLEANGCNLFYVKES